MHRLQKIAITQLNKNPNLNNNDNKNNNENDFI